MAGILVPGVLGGAISAAPAATADQVASLQAQAAVVAAQLRDDGRHLGELSEQADAATIYAAQVDARLAAARAAAARTGAALAASRAALAAEALAAYTGGAVRDVVPDAAAARAIGPDLVATYGELAAGTTRDAIRTYDRLRAEQATTQAALAAGSAAAHSALTALLADRAAAEAAQAAQEQLLSSLHGQLATLVAAAQAEQAAQAAAQEQAALAAVGQAAPATPRSTAGTSPPPATGSRPGGPPTAAPAPATTPPTPRPAPATVPPTTVPPTTVPPATVPPATGPPTTAGRPPTTTGGGLPAQAPGAPAALAYARAQLGKPYQWGGAGPGSFDCSGLVMVAWEQGGVPFPHLAQLQYEMTTPEPISAALPGDLVFFGTPTDVYHVGIYVGGGEMIDAPSTGQDVQVQGIWWSDLLGAGRVAG